MSKFLATAAMVVGGVALVATGAGALAGAGVLGAAAQAGAAAGVGAFGTAATVAHLSTFVSAALPAPAAIVGASA